MTINFKTKNLKPTDISVNLIYRCPSCYNEHWLSLMEAQTPKFKVVCECGIIFAVKRVRDIVIDYEPKKEPIIKQEESIVDIKPETVEVIEPKPYPNEKLLSKCVKILIGYGFIEDEAKNFVIDEYQNQPTDNCVELVKNTLTNIGTKKNV